MAQPPSPLLGCGLMDVTTRVSILVQTSFFDGVDPSVIEEAAKAAAELRLERDTSLFHQGDEPSHSYLLAAGRVRLDQATSDGRNVLLRYFGVGEMIGTVAVLRRKPYPAAPISVEPGLALYWSASATAKLVKANPQIAQNAIGLIGGRLEDLQERLREISSYRVEQRIAATLLRMIDQTGQPVENGIEIPFVISRNDIADMNATTLHSVSRTLAAWEQGGILTGKRTRHIVVARPDRLAEISAAE